MILVLHKAFDILEYLAQDPHKSRMLKEISGHFRMNAGTCANILKTMVQRKFVDQADTRGGYLPGPMLYYLSRMSSYRADLISAAEPPMVQLAKQVNETVLLTILRGAERFIIIQIDGNQSVQVGRDMFQKNAVYQTATGRLLLAHLNEKELKTLINERGLPGSYWPGVSSMQKLKTALEAIRRRGWTLYKTAGDVTGIAYPIRENDKVIAALGLFLPVFRFKGSHKAAIVEGMSSTADAISQRLADDGSQSKLNDKNH